MTREQVRESLQKTLIETVVIGASHEATLELRLWKELQDVKAAHREGLRASAKTREAAAGKLSDSAESVASHIWEVRIEGPPASPYAGGSFLLDLHFPPTYPAKPPKISFRTKIFHPNVFWNGQICLPLLQHLGGDWTPACSIVQVLKAVVDILETPCLSTLVPGDAARLFTNQRERFEEAAVSWTSLYATSGSSKPRALLPLPWDADSSEEESEAMNEGPAPSISSIWKLASDPEAVRQLLCSWCRQVCARPVATAFPCGHNYCSRNSSCGAGLAVGDTCALEECQERIEGWYLNERIASSLDSLPVTCGNSQCGQNMPYGDYEAHRKLCQFSVVECDFPRCSQRTTRGRIHRHKQRCGHALERCKCKESVPRWKRALHNDTCPAMQVPCSRQRVGCPVFTSPSPSHCKEHLAKCGYQAWEGEMKQTAEAESGVFFLTEVGRLLDFAADGGSSLACANLQAAEQVVLRVLQNSIKDELHKRNTARHLCIPVATFTLDEVSEASDSFSEDHAVHHGSASVVYRGVLLGMDVLIKKFKKGRRVLFQDIRNEVHMRSLAVHPQLAQLMGWSPDGRCIIIESPLSSVSLAARLRRDGEEPALTWDERLAVCAEVVEALTFLRQRHVAHCDLSPESVLLDAQGRVKLTEIGPPVQYAEETEELKMMWDILDDEESLEEWHEEAEVPNDGMPASIHLRRRRPSSEKLEILQLGLLVLQVITGLTDSSSIHALLHPGSLSRRNSASIASHTEIAASPRGKLRAAWPRSHTEHIVNTVAPPTGPDNGTSGSLREWLEKIVEARDVLAGDWADEPLRRAARLALACCRGVRVKGGAGTQRQLPGLQEVLLPEFVAIREAAKTEKDKRSHSSG
eukprot:TRINITY_DN18314_c0_g1_i1.p1 TRINITY_DN18314_c0_g1~~TRINITY_DN18314_c0_g1_i1.p1  ORF type:complete len:864 (+),score=94.61 TRINITY_DN18314_c0_g1_i1:442-3033(+)